MENEVEVEQFIATIRNIVRESAMGDLEKLSQQYTEYMAKCDDNDKNFNDTQVRIAEALERIATCLEFAPGGPGMQEAAQNFQFNASQQNTA